MNHLSNKSENPYCVVNWVCEQSNENVSLAMNLPGVNFIEKGHHDKSVEDHCKVNGGRSCDACTFAIINVKEQISCSHNQLDKFS